MITVLTGIQANGDLHMGNYLTAMRLLLDLQNKGYKCYFCIADLHALTVRRDPSVIQEAVKNIIALHLGAGIDKVEIFLQSSIPAHSEAAWLLQCVTPMGELSRMTQFKQKKGIESNNTTLVGLYTYPVLQAADILLYQADLVPVGEDQRQHIELTRSIAGRFQHLFGREVFKLPEPMISKDAARIMSLDNPLCKMSKSGNPSGCLYLLDTKDNIAKKIKKAVTDSDGHIFYDPVNKPGISNLLVIYKMLTDYSIDKIVDNYSGKGYGIFKKDLIEVIWNCLSLLQENYKQYINSDILFEKLKQGNATASIVANKTLVDMRQSMGLLKI